MTGERAREPDLLPPGAHGGDGERLAALLGVSPNAILDLSASLNPVAADPAPVVARHIDAIGRYPDDAPATATAADAMGVEVERFVLTNGGAEAIALVAQLCPIGRIDEPEFSLYGRHLRVVDPLGPRWMSDPNNPTGRLAGADERAFVRDEAFYPLATGVWTREDADTIVVGSMTKVLRCPGLRIGYIVAPDDVIARQLADLRPRWSVNGLAIAALPELLEQADLRAWARAVAELRGELAALLVARGLEPSPGAANFLWLPRAAGLRQHLLPLGILVRSGASFGHPDAVRIAVPDTAGLERLARALETFDADTADPADTIDTADTDTADLPSSDGARNA